MKHKISVVIALLLLSLTTVTVVAQSGGSYDLTWSSIDGGSGALSGGNYAMVGTIGQADAGTLLGGAYTLRGGFLAGMSLPLAANYHVYLPLIRR
ncbi:hypothetical protein TFLX_03451 [Thermoflexales bacterium]|jgi:hypothetical protein|nr:hypothetical protein TFLX_03451 [Thermoflexales bacterium]